MKAVLFLALAGMLAAQTSDPSQSTPKKGGGTHIPESAGDDVRGYNDTPQLPGQPWKVHDMRAAARPQDHPGRAVYRNSAL